MRNQRPALGIETATCSHDGGHRGLLAPEPELVPPVRRLPPAFPNDPILSGNAPDRGVSKRAEERRERPGVQKERRVGEHHDVVLGHVHPRIQGPSLSGPGRTLENPDARVCLCRASDNVHGVITAGIRYHDDLKIHPLGSISQQVLQLGANLVSFIMNRENHRDPGR